MQAPTHQCETKTSPRKLVDKRRRLRSDQCKLAAEDIHPIRTDPSDKDSQDDAATYPSEILPIKNNIKKPYILQN
jgi:hypothetical protein